MTPSYNRAAALTVAAFFLLAGGSPEAQALTVLPVTVQMTPGQLAVSLTVINQESSETTVQIRAFSWSQSGADGDEQLTASDAVLASPPIATIAPATAQVVRLVLRLPPHGMEATYRILLDQIPPPAQPGVVQIALRMSIPIFAEPATRAVAHVQYRVERHAGQAYLVAVNDGSSHETLRDITLKTSAGSVVKTEADASPYILAGATRRWRITEQASLPASGGTLRLTAQADAGAVDQQVSVSGS
jgi:fimbrial chaperone protein